VASKLLEIGHFSRLPRSRPSCIAPRRSAVRIRLAPSPKCPARRKLHFSRAI